MQFLLIMGIGTLIAIWVVANQPKPRGRKQRRHGGDIISLEQEPVKPAWRGELGEVYSTDEFDYMRKMERHENDSRRWPAPFPPPPLKRRESETEYN